MSVGVVNKQTGDRIPTAGMPAVDSVLSGTSTNPVQNKVVKEALDDKADTDMVAADFNAGTSYTAGNYCVQDGKLYKFKNNHSGAWSASDVDEVKITGELSSLKNGLTNNSVNLTSSELFQIINQGSHMLTSGVLHIFAKIKCIALPAEGVNNFDFVFLPSGKEIVTNQRGIVINVGKASSEWVTPSNLVYGYVGTSSISGHTSDLTVGSYYLIDVIIKFAVS